MNDPLLTAASVRPDAPALGDGSTSMSWSELAQAASGLAAAMGAASGARVGLLARDAAGSVVAIHAVRLSGGVLVPLHGRLTPAELMDRLSRARVSLLLHDRAHAASAASLAHEVGITNTMDIGATASGGPAIGPLDPTTDGAVVHTSGTTATARGVVLSHDALLASAAAWNTFLDAGPADHWLSTLPLAHVAGLGMVLRSVLSGALLTVHERFDPQQVSDALEREGVSLMSLVPTQLGRLLDVGVLRVARLRALLLGGGPVAPALVQRAIDAGLPIVTTYGLTEAASGVSALPADEASTAPGSAGRPLPGVQLRIVGTDGVDVPPGRTGSILVGGPTLAKAYDREPAATRAALSDGWLRTRDVGTIDAEGRLWVTDRQDELIISGGENVSPAEVEAVLAGHPQVGDVAVVGRTHPTWGAVPVMVVVPRDVTRAPALEDLRARGRERLAAYKLPVAMRLVAEVPRTPSGKVVRREIGPLLDSTEGIGAPGAWDVARPDGATIRAEVHGAGTPVVLLHATLSNAAELRGLAQALSGMCRVIAIDRRAAGASRMPPDDPGGAVDVATNIDDILAVLDLVIPGEPALLVGHSYGGCVALELAARQPGRVTGVWMFEPPYLPLLSGSGPSGLVALGDRVAALARDQGPTAAALAFLDAVRGPGTADRLPAAARARLGAEGRGAVADAALRGLDPNGLGRITCPVVLGLGGRSVGPYAMVADALTRRVPTLTVERFAELGHGGPVSQATRVAASIRAFAKRLDDARRPGQTEAVR